MNLVHFLRIIQSGMNGNVTTSSTFGYLTQCVSKIIITGAESGYFTPVMPIEDILAFIIASFDGIIRDVTLSKCYLGKVCRNQVLLLLRKA